MLMTILGREVEVVPVGLRLKLGAVAPLFTKFSGLPARLKVGAVPVLLGLLKFSRFRIRVPVRSFVTVRVVPAVLWPQMSRSHQSPLLPEPGHLALIRRWNRLNLRCRQCRSSTCIPWRTIRKPPQRKRKRIRRQRREWRNGVGFWLSCLDEQDVVIDIRQAERANILQQCNIRCRI